MRTIGGKNGKREYVLQTVIGQGSFGKVYHSPPYAIKEIAINFQQYALTAIRNETSILRQLDHPNIVKLFDIIEENNSLFMIMEYCHMDLSQYLKKCKMDEPRATDIICQLVAGLRYLVEKGVIHRDIKPANILVNSRGDFKLADFGLARYVQEYDNCLLQTVAGTPLYMAPQILKKASYTTKCDIWSSGIIFYELLVGKLPWIANNQKQLLYSITHKPLHLPSGLSDWSKNLLARMIVIGENERIGWDQLFGLIRTCPSNRPKSRSRERPSSAKSQTNISDRGPVVKVAKECLSYPANKLRQLLTVDLQECLDEGTVRKILKEHFQASGEEGAKVREVLSCYNEQLRAWYLRELPNLRTTD